MKQSCELEWSELDCAIKTMIRRNLVEAGNELSIFYSETCDIKTETIYT